MSTAAREKPQPPAAAYVLMEKLVGPAYFLKPPPSRGTRVFVWGGDNVRTTWDMTDIEAAHIVKKLRLAGVRFATEPFRH